MAEGKNSEEEALLSSPKEDTPIRAVVCLKRKEDVKLFEKTEDCFILDFDPFESLHLSRFSLDDNKNNNDVDLSIVAEKGQVACRDYPHSRHLCLKFPFSITPHESYCEMLLLVSIGRMLKMHNLRNEKKLSDVEKAH